MDADRQVDKLNSRSNPPSPGDKSLPRGVRCNNPGNIRAGIGFKGEVGADAGGYAIFDSAHNGIRAIAVDLLTKYRRGLVTVRSIISKYAPPSENDTESYIRAVCKALRVTADNWLHLTDWGQLAAFVTAIIQHENGMNPYTKEAIDAACADAMHGR